MDFVKKESIYFISDIHLLAFPNQYPQLLQALSFIEKKADHLYILGDLFGVWWGPDYQYPPFDRWYDVFTTLSCPISFLPGNRDFLFDKKMTQRWGWNCLTPGHVIDYAGKKIALFHGDEPGLLDRSYQRIRPILRSSFLKNLFLTLPEPLRQKMCLKARISREDHQQWTPLEIDYQKWIMQSRQIPEIIIHGHLHYEKITYYDEITIYQLGSWDGGAASMLEIKKTGEINFLDSTLFTKDFFL
ncbi:MAG: hypothetical protein FJ161_02445 [Gammaproteobacteria bacterium]|nr:hypothetical protein [Gammaproteobacteria bacterium]